MSVYLPANSEARSDLASHTQSAHNIGRSTVDIEGPTNLAHYYLLAGRIILIPVS